MAEQSSYAHDPRIRAAFFDIDGTLTTGGRVWGALLDSPDVKRLRRVWLYATAMPHYMLSQMGMVSQTGFRNRWVRLMAWLMTNWPVDRVQSIYDQIVHGGLMSALRPDMVEILKQHKAQGHYVALVSTMFEGIVSGLASQLGADAGIGSSLEMHNGQCAGRIVGPPCAGGRKVEFVQAHLAQALPGISLEVCAAYADSQSDIPFLSGMGNPVATYPDDVMREVARQHGWRIYEGDAL